MAVQTLLLVVGTVMLCAGALRGEAATVLSKAIRLCLECVGIGLEIFRYITKTDSLSRLHSGSGGSVEQPASAKFSEGRNLSGSRKNSMCAGT